MHSLRIQGPVEREYLNKPRHLGYRPYPGFPAVGLKQFLQRLIRCCRYDGCGRCGRFDGYDGHVQHTRAHVGYKVFHMRQMPSLHFAESEVAAGRVAGGLEDGQLVIPVRRAGGRCVCVCVCVRERERKTRRQRDKETGTQGDRVHYIFMRHSFERTFVRGTL